MASVQYEVAVFTERPKPIDTSSQTGVHYDSKPEALVNAARVHVTPALAEVRRVMQEIRASGKCGMIVVRWDRQAWCISKVEPPARVNEA